MPLQTVYAPYRFPSFRNGIWKFDDPTVLARDRPGTLADGNDITFQGGIVHKRFGFDNLGGVLSGTIQRVLDFFQKDLTQHTLAIGTAGAWDYNDGTGVWTLRTSYAGSPLIIPSTAVFNGIFVAVNGNDTLRSWDGIAANFSVLGGNPPTTARGLLGYKNHLIAIYPTIGGTIYPFRMIWSDFNNINQWASGDAGLVDLLETNDPFQALSSFGEWGVLGRRFSIWNILPANAPAFYQLQKSFDRAGVLAPASMQVVPQGVYYLSDDDLYIYNAISGSGVGQGMRNVIAMGTPGYANMGAVVSTTDIDHAEYWMAFPSTPSASGNDRVLVHGYKDGYLSLHNKPFTALGGRASVSGKTWSAISGGGALWAPIAGSTWSQVIGSTGYPLLCGALGAQPLVQSPAFSDNGVGIISSLTTAMTDMDDPSLKRLSRAALIFVAQLVGLLTIYILTSDIGDLSTAASFGPYTVSLAGQREAWVDIDDVPPAKYFAVKIVHNAASDIGLKEIALWKRSRGVWG
jgi:hypothetical protein